MHEMLALLGGSDHRSIGKVKEVIAKEGHMTTESSQQQKEVDDPFAYLSPYEFVLLTTFRKSRVGVSTAMWFAHEGGKLYMVTGRNSGKIKRIRNNRQVLLAPCDLMGNVLGPQIEAFARELPADQHPYANALLAQKYGEEYEIDSSGEGEEADEETFIEIVSSNHSLRETSWEVSHE